MINKTSDKFKGRWFLIEDFYDYQFNKNKFMQGYKTWSGLLIIFLGWFGLGDLISEDKASEIINAILELGGLLVAIWGNYKAHKQIEKLGGY